MEYYNSLLQGDQGALKRALYKSMGFTDEVLSKPLVAVVNSYTNATPGHFNLNILSERVQKGIEASGGTAMTFSTIAPCDGIAEGHIGMRYCLPSRDVIADSVECMVMAHKFDAMVLMGSCDKIVPGMLMAAARLNIPAIFLNGGPMYPAEYKGKHYDGNIVTEAVGWKKQGKIDEQEFRYIENISLKVLLLFINIMTERTIAAYKYPLLNAALNSLPENLLNMKSNPSIENNVIKRTKIGSHT